ncbi:MAG: septum formation inhibitor Maf [Actinobacteria bacterium]|nr:septum formation inhibitor Maf [Actinomycetota bacterium]
MKKNYNGKLILASQSPRRADLLSLIGFDFDVRPSRIDEDSIRETEPEKHVKALSLAKAKKVARSVEKGLVVGADTIVVLNGEILGKPSSPEDAARMLRKLSGRVHKVYTGFTIIEMPGGRTVSDFEMTAVRFRQLADWEIKNYVSTQNPMDKAGAYGIQDQSAVFAERIEGCFYNVVGFPLTKFYVTLLEFVQKDH